MSVPVHWRATDCEFFIHVHELVVVFRRPRTVKKVRFSIRKASALYDIKFREDILYTKSDKPIRIGIKPSGS